MIVFSQDRTMCCGNMTDYIWKVMSVTDVVENDGSPIDAQPYEYAVCCCYSSDDIEIFAIYDSESTAKIVLKNMVEKSMYIGTYTFPSKLSTF